MDNWAFITVNEVDDDPVRQASKDECELRWEKIQSDASKGK